MPSWRAADALIVWVSLALVVRRRWVKALWLLWPAWVWFSVMASGNHLWLDVLAGNVLAGIVLALLAGAVLYRPPLWRRAPRAPGLD